MVENSGSTASIGKSDGNYCGMRLGVSSNPVRFIASCAAFGVYALATGSLRCMSLHDVFVLLPMLSGKGRAQHGELLRACARLVEEGKLRPWVNENRFTLEQALAAHNQVENGKATGKTVIDVSS